MRRRLVWTVIVVAIGSLAASADAIASGFAIRENCTEGLGTAFAGAGSLADDPCTVFNNPAGMTKLQGTQLEFGATPVFPTINFHGTDTPNGGNSGNNAGRSALLPNLYGVTDITPDLKAGIAITSPLGLPIKYNSAWAGRYLVIQAEALSVDINPNIAYKFSDRLSIAGGISAQYLSFAISNAINQAPLGTSSDALARFKGDNWAVGYNLAILIDPLPGTRVGLTYRSKIDHKLSGDQNFLNVGPALGPALASSPATVDLTAPATTGLSVTHKLTPTLTIASDVQWTQWSAFKGVGINATIPSFFNESYTDSWFTSLGLIYHPNDTWTWRGGIGWDQSPVQNRYRDVAVPDQDRYMVGLGFGYQLTAAIGLDFAYAHYFATHASMNDSINNTAPGAVPGVTTTTLQGSYQLSLDYLSAAVRFKF
jgi:long-chain fatty acid transport protein